MIRKKKNEYQLNTKGKKYKNRSHSLYLLVKSIREKYAGTHTNAHTYTSQKTETLESHSINASPIISYSFMITENSIKAQVLRTMNNLLCTTEEKPCFQKNYFQ